MSYPESLPSQRLQKSTAKAAKSPTSDTPRHTSEVMNNSNDTKKKKDIIWARGHLNERKTGALMSLYSRFFYETADLPSAGSDLPPCNYARATRGIPPLINEGIVVMPINRRPGPLCTWLID
ncbi:hypothetical protein JTE90_026317 [Oedothorax gibbosus]|uniref:Uncharacterized protein n=1 Tax=Oedothorax gibbosus TaxID=931172 RepID=A0AAV6U5U8_9ARAC|nr:hypothetical protein JTE90_026317 [Oedothorax gibbosus]